MESQLAGSQRASEQEADSGVAAAELELWFSSTGSTLQTTQRGNRVNTQKQTAMC